MEVSCPQCGNPNLDVDEANSVVYCKKCGFAVKVDPQSGQVVPLSEGGGGGEAAGPEVYSGQKRIFGFNPLTFFLGGTAILLFLIFIEKLTWSYFMLAESIIVIIWWYNH